MTLNLASFKGWKAFKTWAIFTVEYYLLLKCMQVLFLNAQSNKFWHTKGNTPLTQFEYVFSLCSWGNLVACISVFHMYAVPTG